MKHLFFLCSLLASLNLHAWSCFGNDQAAPVQKNEAGSRPSHTRLLAHEAIATSSDSDAPFTLLETAEAGEGPYSVSYSPSGKFVAVPNSSDGTVSIFKVGCDNALEPVQTVTTTTQSFFPITASYSPCDRFAAVANMDFDFVGQGSVTVYKVNCETGTWDHLQTLLPPDVASPYWVRYSPNGRFVAVASYNEGDGTSFVSMFRVHPLSGLLTHVDNFDSNGAWTLAFSPDSKFLAVVDTDTGSVLIYRVDPVTGVLTQIPGLPAATGNAPEGITYQHNGKFAAVANFGADTVSVYAVDQVSGAFTQAIFPDVPVDGDPYYIAFSKDDTVVAVGCCGGGISGFGAVNLFCVDQETPAWTPLATIPFETNACPEGVDFAPCSDTLAVSLFFEDSVQLYHINDELCP